MMEVSPGDVIGAAFFAKHGSVEVSVSGQLKRKPLESTRVESDVIVPKRPTITNRNKIPVCIVEDHSDVLACIYRLIGSKRIPLDGLAFLHFDSHSDLSIPQNLDADDTLDKHKLFSSVSIENWIIPMVYGGHVSKVIWVKPFWSRPSFRPHSLFSVGKQVDTGKIKVSSPDNYFLSELSYATDDDLINAKPCELHVVTLGDRSICDCSDCKAVSGNTSSTACPPTVDADLSTEPMMLDSATANSQNSSASAACVSSLTALNESGCDADGGSAAGVASFLTTSLDSSFILDIDLDFFSTSDPFRLTLTDRQRRLMYELYHYTPPLDSSEQSIRKCVEDREKQISYIRSVLRAAQDGQLTQLTDNSQDRLLLELFHSIKYPVETETSDIAGLTSIPIDPEFDYEWLHEIGTGIDDCPLPHHVSSPAVISCLVDVVKDLLRELPKPVAITIARSSNDDYCPPDDVDAIQNNVLAMLESLYLVDNLDVQLKY